ncbi:MAG: hypothetical protein ACRYG4_13390 [Janthinobacterium lividum]
MTATTWAQTRPTSAVGQKLVSGEAYVTLVQLTHQPISANNGRLVIAYEERGMKGMPVYESADEGSTWQYVVHATDTVRGDGARCNIHWQPHLMEMPRTVGTLAAGTILMSASTVCNDDKGRVAEQYLRLYASTDVGRTWTMRGEVVHGTADLPVWEPNLRLLDDGKLVTYYSSEVHKAEGFNQLLGHKVSSDGGLTWGPEVRDVAFTGGVERPGMAIVERLPDKRYVLSYESVDGPTTGDQVHVKFSKDGLDWGRADARGLGVQTDGGQYPVNCPVISWFPTGGPNGVLIVSSRGADGGGDSSGRSIYWNTNNGIGPWWEASAPVQKRPNGRAGWTQAMMLKQDGSFLHITSSGSAEAPDDASKNEILFASARIDFNRYEAEDAARSGGSVMRDASMSNHSKVRLASEGTGHLKYRIYVAKAGKYQLALNYANIGFSATPRLSVGGKNVSATASAASRDELSLAVRNRDLGTRGTGEKIILEGMAVLTKGENVIEVAGGAHALDIDFLEVTPVA